MIHAQKQAGSRRDSLDTRHITKQLGNYEKETIEQQKSETVWLVRERVISSGREDVNASSVATKQELLVERGAIP